MIWAHSCHKCQGVGAGKEAAAFEAITKLLNPPLPTISECFEMARATGLSIGQVGDSGGKGEWLQH